LKAPQAAKNMFIATIFFALMEVFVKYLNRIPAFEIAFFRALVSLTLGYTHIRVVGLSIKSKNPKMLVIRSLSGTFALALFFSSLQRIPLASAVSIQHLSALFTVLIASFVIKEKASGKEWIFFILGFIGVLMIKGFDTRITGVDLIIAVAAALFSALSYTVIRLLNNKENPLVIVFYFTLTAVPLLAPLTLLYWITPTLQEWCLLFLVGISTQLSQLYMTKAYQAEKAANVTAISYLGIIFAYAFGFFLFDEHLHIMATIGIGLILLSVLMTTAKPKALR
jgi:drug/metabolite transporter (DMT)-like permease